MLEACIRKVEPVAIDYRGPTYEWCNGIPGMQLSVYMRKKDTCFGEHFHLGNDPSKNPERFFLAYGSMHCSLFDGKTGEHFSCEVDAGTELIIPPLILHSMKALTEVVFVEYRLTVFDKNHTDTYPAAEYEQYMAK